MAIPGDVRLDVLEQLENKLYDLKVVLTTSGEVDDRIVIIDIDEKASLK